MMMMMMMMMMIRASKRRRRSIEEKAKRELKKHSRGRKNDRQGDATGAQ